MDWTNLNENKCPQCGKALRQKILEMSVECSKCHFRMSAEKFNDIIEKMFGEKKKRKKDDDDNSSDLNNLGRDVLSEDFSDSPFLNR